MLVFNGVVLGNEGGGWQGVTMEAVQQQLVVVQEDIYMQRLTDSARDPYEGGFRVWAGREPAGRRGGAAWVAVRFKRR